jgi:hypothetical protein
MPPRQILILGVAVLVTLGVAVVVNIDLHSQTTHVESSPWPPQLRSEQTREPRSTAIVLNATTNASANASYHRSAIPFIIHTVWATRDLPTLAHAIAADWKKLEPAYDHRIATDELCSRLAVSFADEFPSLATRYRSLALNVMKADLCRLLVVYRYGGVYRDLDVAHVQPLSQWLNHSQPVVYGHEGEHLCQWFFAAEAGNPCLRDVIQLVVDRIESVTMDFNRHPELVANTTGPGAFTAGMARCTIRPTLTVADLTVGKVHHHFAAMNWRSSYPSWLLDRQRRAGWVDLMGSSPRDAFVRGYIMAVNTELLAPVSNATRPIAVNVRQSTHRFGEELAHYPAFHALDRNLDTFVMTEHLPNQWWHLQIADRRGELDLTCAKVWAKRRLHDSAFFEGITLTLIGRNDTVVYRKSGLGSPTASHFMVLFPDRLSAAVVTGFRLERNGTLIFAEIELFADDKCAVALPLVMARRSRRRPAPTRKRSELESQEAMHQLSAAFRTVDYNCRRLRGVGWEPWMEYSLCLDAPIPKQDCVAVSVSNQPRVSESFANSLSSSENISCAYHAISLAKQAVRTNEVVFSAVKQLRPFEFGNSSSRSLSASKVSLYELVARFADGNVQPVAILHLDAGMQTWSLVDDLVSLGRDGLVDHVLAEFCVDTRVDAARVGYPLVKQRVGEHLDSLRRLHHVFAPYAWHVSPGSPILSGGNLRIPSCMLMSLIRRQAIPDCTPGDDAQSASGSEAACDFPR